MESSIVIDKLVDLVKKTNAVSKLQTGTIQRTDDTNYIATLEYICKDLNTVDSRLLKRDILIEIDRNGSSDKVIKCSNLSPGHFTDVLEDVSSDCKQFRAILRSAKTNENQILEIFGPTGLLHSLNLADITDHGPICTILPFGSMYWSGEKLIYVAQAYKKKAPKPSQYTPDKYDYVPSWGERFTSIEHTCIGILDTSQNFKIKVINLDGRSLANPVVFDRGTKIACVAYLEEPIKLGIYCSNNRPTEIITIEISSIPDQSSLPESNDKDLKFNTIKSEGKCFHTLRVNKDGSKIIMLRNDVLGAHYHPSEIWIMETIADGECSLSKPRRLNDLEIFVKEIPRNCFSSDGEHIILTYEKVLHVKLIALNVINGDVKELDSPEDDITILDFKDDLLLASCSTVTIPNYPILCHFDKYLSWVNLDQPSRLDNFTVEEDYVLSEDGLYKLSAIYLCPVLDKLRKAEFLPKFLENVDDESDLPTCINIHGGPHCCASLRYLDDPIILASLGFKVLTLNYRGSTGVDKEHSSCLVGHIGESDIKDCLYLIETLSNKHNLNRDKLIIRGGSHGGFIGAHLTCQDTFKFVCAVLINPVIDLTLLSTSDMPDWAIAEGLGKSIFDEPSIEEIAQLYNKSPVSKSHLARVPTLMMIGLKDLRVNPCNSFRWIQRLKVNGVPVSVKVYPESNHAIRDINVTIGSTIDPLLWIFKHLSKEDQ